MRRRRVHIGRQRTGALDAGSRMSDIVDESDGVATGRAAGEFRSAIFQGGTRDHLAVGEDARGGRREKLAFMTPRKKYFLKRLLFLVVTFFIAISVNFLLFRALPGDAVANISRIPQASPQMKQALAERFGLDKPLAQQYVIYLANLAKGDLGVSFANQQPVAANLWRALANTIPLVFIGTLMAMVLGLGAGVVSAWRVSRATDHLTVGTSMVLYSLPTQWAGIMLIVLFGSYLPAGGMRNEFLVNPSISQTIIDIGSHLLLPAITLALTLFGSYTLIVRSALLETLGEDYVLTARAKGLSDWKMITRHILPNSMLPITTLVAISIGSVVGGAILVETVFSWPGVGRAIYDAVRQRDFPMLQGAFLILTISVLVCNFVAELLYPKLDPRVTQQ